MLAYREDVAVRVLKPRYLSPVGVVQLTILNKGIFLQGNPSVRKPGCHGFDVLHFPGEDEAPCPADPPFQGRKTTLSGRSAVTTVSTIIYGPCRSRLAWRTSPQSKTEYYSR